MHIICLSFMTLLAITSCASGPAEPSGESGVSATDARHQHLHAGTARSVRRHFVIPGIAAFIYEHGDAGCGDSKWPKSLLRVPCWGTGSATLNGEPLYRDHQIHFMVTQGMRDRETLATH
jgi:hypothetical protein